MPVRDLLTAAFRFALFWPVSARKRSIVVAAVAIWALSIASPAFAQTAIEVTIVAVHDVPVDEGVACGLTEYYGKIRFNRGSWRRSPTLSVAPGVGFGDLTWFESPFTLRPSGWSTATRIATDRPVSTRVDVQIWEYDEFPCGGDDQLDIAPGRPRTVTFRVVNGSGACSVTEVPGFARPIACGTTFRVRRTPGCANCRGVTLRVDRITF
jgi:hypothetical protein